MDTIIWCTVILVLLLIIAYQYKKSLDNKTVCYNCKHIRYTGDECWPDCRKVDDDTFYTLNASDCKYYTRR